MINLLRKFYDSLHIKTPQLDPELVANVESDPSGQTFLLTRFPLGQES